MGQSKGQTLCSEPLCLSEKEVDIRCRHAMTGVFIPHQSDASSFIDGVTQNQVTGRPDLIDTLDWGVVRRCLDNLRVLSKNL